MSDTTPRLGLAELVAAQAQKHVTINEALLALDCLVGTRVLGMTQTVPPTSPADGDAYLVATGGSGAWAGNDGRIAFCRDGGWIFYPPFVGMRVFCAADGKLYVCTASGWSAVANTALTLPSSGALASLSAAQTWSAAQTFSAPASFEADIRASGSVTAGTSAGRLLLYGGSNWLDGAGFEFYGDSNAANPERSGSAALFFGSTRYSLSTVFSVSAFHGTTTPIPVAVWTTSGEWLPGQDNVSALGRPSARFSVVYAATGAINTSDERQKTNWSDLSDAELIAAEKIEAAVRWFQFADAVAEKTAAGARIHCGVGAQTVWRIMIAAGLETAPAAGEPPDIRHAFLCYDRWDGVPAQIDDKGNEVSPARPAGERYGVRYEELLLFLLAARGRRDDAKIAALTARVAALEAAGKAA